MDLVKLHQVLCLQLRAFFGGVSNCGQFLVAMATETSLESIPDSVLLHSLLPLLDRDSLARLSCCNRRLSVASTSDFLWLPIISSEWGIQENSPDPPPPWSSWHRLFCYKQNRRCVECREHTCYVHILSSSRIPLCERCEHACQKYSLVTKMEAKQRYLCSDEDLLSLRYKKIGMKRFSVYFFLKSDIEAMAARNHHQSVKSHFIDETEDVDFQPEEVSLDSENKPDAFHSGESCSNDIGYGVSLDQEGYNGNSMESTEAVVDEDAVHVYIKDADAEKAHKKETRKEHKRLVKAAKREQRLGKASKMASYDKSCSNGSPSSMNIPNLQSNVGEGKLKKKWNTKREHLIAVNSNRSPDLAEGKSKARSDWIREREWLEIELGPYGISALEFARDS